MPSKYSRSRHAVKHSDVNFEFSHVVDSFKDHRGGVCLVNIVNPSTNGLMKTRSCFHENYNSYENKAFREN